MTEDKNRSVLELLVKVSREVATALDLRTVLQRVLFACIQYVGGERGSVVVMDDHGKPVDATIVYGQQFHDHSTQQLRDTVEKGLAGWVVQNRTAYGKTDFATARRGLCWPNAAPTSAFRMSLVPFVLFPPEGLKRDDET